MRSAAAVMVSRQGRAALPAGAAWASVAAGVPGCAWA
jgi:hypothetical protein